MSFLLNRVFIFFYSFFLFQPTTVLTITLATRIEVSGVDFIKTNFLLEQREKKPIATLQCD